MDRSCMGRRLGSDSQRRRRFSTGQPCFSVVLDGSSSECTARTVSALHLSCPVFLYARCRCGTAKVGSADSYSRIFPGAF